MKKSLEALFYPSSIAIIGASRKEKSIGNGLIKNLADGNYQGKIFPVNPKEEKILGYKCYSKVNEINENVDLALIAIPRDGVKSVLEECAEIGVKAVIVISAGFKEVDEKGKELENQLVEIAKENEMALLGPNCLGVINTDGKSNMNATFAKRVSGAGNISFVSQSGAVGVYALEYAINHRINFAKFASLGNKALTNENDVLEAYLEDKQTQVILAYLEDIADAQIFFDLAVKLRQLKEPKPLVVLKAGGSQSGQRAAASHTGAMTESDDVLDHLFDQYGIIRVDNLEKLFCVSQIFSSNQIPKGSRLCIVSNAGGPGIITADAAEKAGLQVPALSDELQQKLSEDLPETVSLNNPVDLVGDATAERYEKAIHILMDSDEVDILLVLCTPQVVTDMPKIAETVAQFSEKAKNLGKMILAVFADFDPDSGINKILSDRKVPFFRFGNNAIDAYAAVVRYYQLRNPSEEFAKPALKITSENTESLLKQAESRDQKYLTEPEVYRVLEDYGLKIAPYRFIKDKEEAKNAAAEIGYPLVAKVVSEQVIHKSDVSGVVTGIHNEDDLLKAFDEIQQNVEKKKPEAQIKGILIQKMVQKGVELIIGARFNNKYGHLLMFGLGGIFVEILRDVTFRRAPLTPAEAMDMIEGIRSKKILEGIRDMPPLDKDALAECLMRISQLVSDFPQIKEIDLNPVFGLKEGPVVADARLIVKG
jgi:acetyltransferase